MRQNIWTYVRICLGLARLDHPFNAPVKDMLTIWRCLLWIASVIASKARDITRRRDRDGGATINSTYSSRYYNKIIYLIML